jgi:hypothetical protein
MHARVTLFEIDTLRVSLDEAVAKFKERVLPRLRVQPGSAGVMAMATPEGNGLLISFWDTEEAASRAIETGFYDEQVSEFLMLLRQPPGREHYRIVLEESFTGTETRR